jgi:hypothetical protein
MAGSATTCSGYLCGSEANYLIAALCREIAGTPPRMRSQSPAPARLRPVHRDTSADAEPTPRRSPGSRTSPGYLCGCGANSRAILADVASYGIPPRLRSQLQVALQFSDHGRDTSAEAEPTICRRTRSRRPKGYLRGRGASPCRPAWSGRLCRSVVCHARPSPSVVTVTQSSDTLSSHLIGWAEASVSADAELGGIVTICSIRPWVTSACAERVHGDCIGRL